MNDEFLIIWNNLSIHVCSDIRRFTTKIKIRIVLISSYYHWLNLWETIIAAIKANVGYQKVKGKYIYLIKDVY